MSKTIETVTKTASSVLSPIKLLSDSGVKSDYMFLAGFASIGAALVLWSKARNKSEAEKSSSDRSGIFVGHWVPSFFALGLALQHEEHHRFHH